MKRAGVYVAVWVLATCLVGAIAWVAVLLVEEQAGVENVAPLSAGDLAALSPPTGAPASHAGAGEGTPTATAVTTAASPLGPTTTTAPGVPTTSGTTAPPVAAHVVPGGTILVRLEEGRLSLVGATPASGFAVEVLDAGPVEVVVSFYDDDVAYRVLAFISDGEAEFDDTIADIDDGDDDGDGDGGDD